MRNTAIPVWLFVAGVVLLVAAAIALPAAAPVLFWGLLFSGIAAMLAGFGVLSAMLRHVQVAAAETRGCGALQDLLIGSPVPVACWDGEGRISRWNMASEGLFGVPSHRALHCPTPETLIPLHAAVDEALRASDSVNGLKVQMVGAWGNVLDLSVSALRVRRADDAAPMIIAVIEDATPREAGQDARAERHRMQRDALIREVHHRIKNHLQGVAGLLRQHLAGKPLLQPLLETATAQVLTIAAVHGLQGEMHGGVIDLRGFVARIAASISGIMHVPIVLGEGCALLEGLCVAEEEAVPVAMVLNELLMNAVKHRQRTDADAMVRIDALRDGDDVRIMVRNAGFLPPRFDFQLGAQVGNGLGLVRSLLPQHGAALSIVEDGEDVIATLSLTSPAMLVPIAARLRAYAEHTA